MKSAKIAVNTNSDHDDEPGRAQHVPLRQKQHAPPAAGRMRAGAPQFNLVVDRGQALS